MTIFALPRRVSPAANAGTGKCDRSPGLGHCFGVLGVQDCGEDEGHCPLGPHLPHAKFYRTQQSQGA